MPQMHLQNRQILGNNISFVHLYSTHAVNLGRLNIWSSVMETSHKTLKCESVDTAKTVPCYILHAAYKLNSTVFNLLSK